MRIKTLNFQSIRTATIKMVAFFTLVLGVFAATADRAQAISMNTQTGIGALSISVDTTISAGVSVRLKDVNGNYVASQSGGNDYARSLAPCASILQAAGGPGCLGLLTDAPGVSFGFKNGEDKNFAGSQNGDDGRLNFQKKGDITGATFKLLTEIQASLSTGVGDFTLFTRVNAFYDPVLHADFALNHHNRAYDRGQPGDAGLRELGRDLQLLDFALSWDYDIPAGDFIGSIPISLKAGKLAANNWGEATFSFTGISQGIVLNIPAARRPGAQIKEIIGTEWMVYTSIGLPFDVGLSAYYQFHHTPWDLSPSDSPFGISDTPNPSNPSANRLQLSGGASSGTFRRNCGTGGGLIGRALPADCGTAGLDSIIHFTNTYYNPSAVDNDGNSVARQRAEDVRFAHGDLLRARVVHMDADNQGQFGVQLSYYFPYLNGIEFTFSYQNIHSRLPYARIKTDGAPVLTLATIGGSSAMSSNILNGLGCTGVNPAIPINGGGYLRTGQFLDPALQPSTAGDTTNAVAGTAEYVPIAGPLTGGLPGALTGLGAVAGATSGGNYLSNLAAQNGRGTVSDRNNLKVGLDTTHFGGKASGSAAGMRDSAIFHGDASYLTETTTPGSKLQALAGAADQVLTAAGAAWATPHASIAANIRDQGANRYDVARINCAIFAAQPKFGAGAASGPTLAAGIGINPALAALGALSPIGTEYLALQYNTRMELYYPQNLKIIGMGFNTTLPWLEWGFQGEVAWRPDTPLQQDVTEQLVSHASAQGTGLTLGDAASVALSPLVTTGGDGAGGISQAETDWSYSVGAAINGIGGLIPTLGVVAAGNAGPTALPLQAGAGAALARAGAAAVAALTPAQRAMVGAASGAAAIAAATASTNPNAASNQTAITDAGVAAGATITDTDINLAISLGESNALSIGGATPEEAVVLGVAAGEALVAQRLMLIAAAEGQTASGFEPAAAAAAAGEATIGLQPGAALGALAALAATPTTAEALAVGTAFNIASGNRASHNFASSFNPNTFECYLSGACGSNGTIEADMLNVTLGITALYNGSHPFVRLLGADLGIFLAEINGITFLGDIPGGWDGASGILRGDKRSTLACVRYSGTELPLGGLVGLDTVSDFSCTPDKTSIGYSLLGFLDYNNVFGTAWRIRPSMAIRHGVYGNTPSPIPGWRQDALSVNTSVSFAFQNSLNLAVGYVGYFDVGQDNYNPNARLDTFSFNVSYAF